MARITKRVVDTLKPGDRDVFAWDSELRGFGVRVKPSGATSYIVQYRNRDGRSRRLTVGSQGRLTPEEARKEAKLILGEVAKGKDPAGQRVDDRAAPTVAELCERYLVEYAHQHKKPRSVASDVSNVRNHVVPLLGHLKVAAITRADVDGFKRAVRDGKTARKELGPRHGAIVKGGPGVANRCLALLSKMFNEAEKWGLRTDGSNPCRHIERFRERKCERYLSDQELACLGAVLAEVEAECVELASVVPTIRLLLFTGCRLSEILTLRWEWVDFEAGCLRLPDSKTGAKVIYLPAPALEVLAGIERGTDNPYVLPGSLKGRHLVDIQKPWRRIRARATVALWRRSEDKRLSALVTSPQREPGSRAPSFAEIGRAADFELPPGLTDVRLHDLRHSFASVAVAAGEGLHMIGKLLGHTQAQTTHRYAHLAADPMKAAAERVGSAIAAAMGNGRGQVVDLFERGRQP